jgi:hypothetical protein
LERAARLAKTEAGYYVQVITAYLASLEVIITTGSHHSSIINAKVGKGLGELSYP